MSTTKMSRMFMIACEVRPDLPDQRLMSFLGKSWSPVITAGAKHGLAGAAMAIPGVSADQLAAFYMAGAESGATPTADEFRSALAGTIHEAITGNDSLSALDQMLLVGKLAKWYEGKNSANGEDEIDFDAVIDTPPFTKTGFWPLDRLHGPDGLPQGICTVLSRPGVGKTTTALALAYLWRVHDIGEVWICQTEIAASAQLMKMAGITGGRNVFRKGVDRMVFGRRNSQSCLEKLAANPDPNRLVLFDSVTGFCGQGDGPESRTRFADFYDLACQVKNVSRMLIAFTHVKRGTDIADIESAAGSSAIERYSDSMVYLSTDGVPMPNGCVEIRGESLKNRWGSHQRPIKYVFNYQTGECTETDDFGSQVAGEELS